MKMERSSAAWHSLHSERPQHPPFLVVHNSSDHKMSDEPFEALPPSKLGEYKVIGEIAEGTFGKVKSTPKPLSASRLPQTYYLFAIASGHPCNYEPTSSDEVSLQGGDNCVENKNKSSARGRIHAYASSPSHYQVVRAI
jgi:hypothetical protein